MKHFRAINKQTKEVIEFGLEDIEALITDCGHPELFLDDNNNELYMWLNIDSFRHWLKDYSLQYNHKGEYYDYDY